MGANLGERPGNGRGIKGPLGHLDPLVQRRFGVVRQHRDPLLGEDRPCIHFEGGEVDRAAGFSNPGRQRIAHTMPAGKSRQEGRMGIEDPVGERIVDALAQHGAKTRHGDQIELVGDQRGRDARGEGVSVEVRTEAAIGLVRHGSDKAALSCVFESTPGAESILEANGIDAEGAEIILRREILSTAKAGIFVNNQPATVQVLKLLAPELALVHAQTESLSSFDQSQQRLLLDRFAGISLDAVSEAHARWHLASAKLNDLLHDEQDRLRMVDLWSYQSKEIEQAHIVPGEDEALETEKRVLANAKSSTPPP